MDNKTNSLAVIFKGWDDYQASLTQAVAALSPEQLAWRPLPHLRSVGQVVSHISLGRIGWFARMDAPGSVALAAQVEALDSEEDLANNPTELVSWLDASWQMIDQTLREWTTADLAKTYRQPFHGQVYAVSRQWTIWRIMAHDLHHGGELAVMLGTQGIAIPELGDFGGHTTFPPLAD